MKFIDLFAGCGGIRIGLEKEGFECVFSSENNRHAQEIYEANFGEVPEGDITKIEAKDIPKHDMIAAGFPCQPFSISGKKLGYLDTRGTLFFEILRIAKAHNTEIILLENVKNLVHHDKGNTFKVIIESLKNLNYNVEFKLLNAKDFSTAQNRERIIIVATKNKKVQLDDIVKGNPIYMKDIVKKEDSIHYQYIEEKEYTLLKKEDMKKQKSGLIFTGYLNKEKRKKGVRPNTEHLSRVHRQPNRIYSWEGTHPTLNAQEKSGRYYIKDNKGVRKITLYETKKMMGFPDDYKLVGSEAQIRERLGNSVCVPMIVEIAKKIKNAYKKETV